MPRSRRRTRLAFRHATTWFEAPMVHCDAPGLARPAFPLWRQHCPVIGGPVFHVPVLGNRPQHSAKPIAAPLRRLTFLLAGYRHGGQEPVPRSLGVHPPVGPQLAGSARTGPVPDRFQILPAGLPTVEPDPTGLQAPPLRHPPPASAGSGRSWSVRSGDGHRPGKRRVAAPCRQSTTKSAG